MTTVQLGSRETATDYQVGDWVTIIRHPKPALVGQVVRVRSITGSGLLVVERLGQVQGDLVSPKAVERYEGEPPARERVPLSDVLPPPSVQQPEGLGDDEWERIRAEAAPAIAQVTGRRMPTVAVVNVPPAVEELPEEPVLLSEGPVVTTLTPPPSSDWNAELARLEQRPTLEPLSNHNAKPRRTQSEAHKRAIQEGKARKKAEREAASTVTVNEPGAALPVKQESCDEAPTVVTVARTLDPTVRPTLRRTEQERPRDLRPARLEARIAEREAERYAALVVPEFDLAQGARQLLMDALAAQQPVVSLNPLIDWLQQLEQGGAA